MEPQDPGKIEQRPSSLAEIYEEYLQIRNKEMPKGDSFYAVYIPDGPTRDPALHVFTDKSEAMKLLKKTKKARFRHFTKYKHAYSFANEGFVDAPKSPERMNGYNNNVSQAISERLSPFKAPKPQDLVKLRKVIDAGDLERFKTMVWSNPRYLVSNGDTPAIVQEGYRYNALHIAAKANHAALAEAILNTISNHKFIRLLYGEDYLCDNIEARIQVLLDLYLNTPDKGHNETPLHFASKYGSLDVVKALVAFAECDKSLRNKYGETPDMIICHRCDRKEDLDYLKKQIALHLNNSFYVPVLRAEDDSVPPLIGEPFSPGKPAVTSPDPLSPRLEIHAFAGPMNKESAERFRKVWRTPPRTSTPKRRREDDDSLDSILSLRFTDLNKGLERAGQKLADKFDVGWKEYWSFLDSFVDITSREGLMQLENHLRERYILIDKGYKSSPDSPDQMSTVAELCVRMECCEVDDDSLKNSPFRAHLCVEKACEVFANRFMTEFLTRMNENLQSFVLGVEVQTRHLELCMLNYMDDYRFRHVNFSVMHCRVAVLTGSEIAPVSKDIHRVELLKALKNFLTEAGRAYDCFSSDDEANYPEDNKPTSTKKQLICILRQFLDNFDLETKTRPGLVDEQSCQEAWNKSKECCCVFHFKRPRKGIGLGRHSRSKGVSKSSRKLNFGKHDQKNDDSSTDEEFYTPPTSPNETGPSEDEFSDVPTLVEVFVENARPTKTDNALYKALKYSNCHITAEKYPHIYRWFHNVNLYTDEERESWRRAKPKDMLKHITPPRYPSFRAKNPQPSTPPPSTSWFRITGTQSPRASFHNKIYL